MLVAERHRWILDSLNARGSVRTSEVAEALDVTDETVRRDFEKLEAKGSLMRSHGGAIRMDPSRCEPTVHERAGENVAAKQAIARAALKRVQPGQTIYLDASTTVLSLALLLPDKPLTVVTSGLQIAMALAGKKGVQCILLGGLLHESSLACIGWAAEKALEFYNVNQAFISCRGLDKERGLSETSEVMARLKSDVIALADKVVLLADHSKVEVASSYFYARPSEIDAWITDTVPAPHVAAALIRQGVQIEVVPGENHE